MLGPPQVRLDGAPLDTDRRKAIALLAYLAVTARAHTREQLAALLWPDYTRDSALAYLRRTLWELNHSLGKEWLRLERDNIALPRAPGLWVDTDDFLTLTHSPSSSNETLAQALALYRGDFLSGFYVADTASFEDWQRQQSEYFQRELGRACERLVKALLESGDFEFALPYAQRWLSLDTLNESAQRALMRLYAAMGDRAALLRQYENCTQMLKDELGVAPQPETSQLYQQLLQSSAAAAQPKQVSHTTSRRTEEQNLHLPALPTPFIGRRSELEQIKALLLDPAQRLVTLTGPGGTGKTRLSIQAASEVAEHFPDGVWFAPLAALQSAEGLVPAVAKALDFSFYKEEERPRQQLLEYLWEKELLLILDNFEHLAGNGALQLVSDILQTARRVKLLVTSRVRLNVQGEQLYQVKGMRVPEPSAVAAWQHPDAELQSFSGLNLFVERARRVQPTFQLDSHSLVHAAEICQLVEGLPLGIELAAAWLELLTPGEIAAEIRHSLDFLESQAADISDRQRSLRAVFESSWKLLDDNEQQAFLYLCVFQGSFSREAAQAVSGGSLRTLLALANKSWLGQSGEGRYALHPLLRQYGYQRLRTSEADWRAAMERHAAYYTGFMETQGKAMRGAGQTAALDAVAEDLEGIRAAWEWLVEQQQFQALIESMLPGLLQFSLIRGWVDEFIVLAKLARIAAPASGNRQKILQHIILETAEVYAEIEWMIFDDQPKERLVQVKQQIQEQGFEQEMGYWHLLAIFAYLMVNFDEGARQMRSALSQIESLSDRWERGLGYFLLGLSYIGEEQLEVRERYALKALAISREVGAIHEQGSALQLLGDVAWRKREYQQGFEYKRAALELLLQVGDLLGAGWVWYEMANTYLDLGQTEQAFHAYQERRKIYEKVGNRRMIGVSLSWESLAASRYKSLDYALETRKRSLEASLEARNQNDIAWHTWELGEVYRLMGDFEQARAWYQKALPLFEKAQDAIMLGYYERGFGDLALSQGEWEVGRARFERALAHFDRDQRDFRIWGQAYALTGLGRALVGLGRLEEAQARLRQAMENALRWTGEDLKFISLLGFASLFAAQGNYGPAVELAAFLCKHPACWNETKALARAVLENVGDKLPGEARQAIIRRGEELTLDAAVAQTLR